MKLTKAEIQYIDNYLIKNEVKFWDVRLELLDHIVSAVEDKITNDGISFNEALLEVHRSFGNSTKNSYIHHLDLEKPLFVNNKGFQKFTLKVQSQISRKHFKLFWRTFLKFICSARFIAEASALLLIAYIIWNYFGFKKANFVLIVAIVVVEAAKYIKTGLKKFTRHSLNIQLALTLTIFYTQIPYWLKIGFDWYYEDIKHKPFYLLFLATFAVFALSRHSFNTFKIIYETTKERYQLLTS